MVSIMFAFDLLEFRCRIDLESTQTERESKVPSSLETMCIVTVEVVVAPSRLTMEEAN
jgi:hypothetical protein